MPCLRASGPRSNHPRLIIKGEGGAFAAGTEISQFTSVTTREDALAYERKLDGVIDRLERVDVATIAQVEGVAAGGGCAIALACDLRVCTPAARFGVPIARTLGNCLSVTNYARLLELVGPAHLKDLLFTGRLIDAAEAKSIGLVSRMAETDTIDSVVEGARAGDRRECAAHHSRDQGSLAQNSAQSTAGTRGDRRSDCAVLHER